MGNSATAFALLGGGYFDPYAEEIDHTVITVESLAVGLRATNRFRCQTRRPISVAEHLLRQLRFSRLLAPPELRTAELDVWALVDDAHESLTPWGDAPTPCKTEWMRGVEAKIDIAIAKALGLGICPDAIRQVVKDADRARTRATLFSPIPGQVGQGPLARQGNREVEADRDHVGHREGSRRRLRAPPSRMVGRRRGRVAISPSLERRRCSLRGGV
jgi:hypothetical protein